MNDCETGAGSTSLVSAGENLTKLIMINLCCQFSFSGWFDYVCERVLHPKCV